MRGRNGITVERWVVVGGGPKGRGEEGKEKTGSKKLPGLLSLVN